MKNGAQAATDVVVVGGGLAGLTAATYLAKAGRSVTVLERSSHLGGRGITNTLGEFQFNLGPHALYRKAQGAAVLRELGISYTAKIPPVRGRFLRNGSLHYLSMSPLSIATTRLLSARSRLALGKLYASIFRTKPSSVRDLSVEQWLATKTKRADLHDLALALIRVATYTSDAERLSAEVALLQVQLAGRGVLYLDGGWQTLVDGLRAAAENAGARIVTGAKVAAIEQDGAFRSVRLEDGKTIDVSAAILAVEPATAASLLGDAGAALRRWADSAIPVRAACLDIGVSTLPQPKETFALGVDKPYYFSVHSATAKLAPPDAATIVVAKYLSTEDAGDAKETERELEAWVDLCQPGWRDVTVQRRFLPNMTVVGAMATAAQGGLAGRAPVDGAGVRNVYLTGDWVGAEGWLSDGAFASAKAAAQAALRASSATQQGALTASYA